MLGVECRLSMLRDGGDEVFGAGAGGLDVFRADFEDFFEVYADVGEFALEEDDNLAVSWLLRLLTLNVLQRSSSRFCCAHPPARHRRCVIEIVAILTRSVRWIFGSSGRLGLVL